MVTIKIVNTGIEIKVNNADEMHLVFFRLNTWEDLEVNGKVFPHSTTTSYTPSYFQKFYFEKG